MGARLPDWGRPVSSTEREMGVEVEVERIPWGGRRPGSSVVISGESGQGSSWHQSAARTLSVRTKRMLGTRLRREARGGRTEWLPAGGFARPGKANEAAA